MKNSFFGRLLIYVNWLLLAFASFATCHRKILLEIHNEYLKLKAISNRIIIINYLHKFDSKIFFIILYQISLTN